jgi:predicted ATPase/DNA-binding XRE family transcriptional regulator
MPGTSSDHTRNPQDAHALPIACATMPLGREGSGAMRSAEPSGFGELLRQYRTAARLTQEELAEQAGLSVRGVQDLERGLRRSPHPETTRRLVDALGLGDAERAELLGVVARAGLSSLRDSALAGPPTITLPLPLTSFVGRAADLSEIQRLLSTTRLLTLTGAGGIGKTRLALEAARHLADEYRDGAGLVELAALSDPGLVPQAVADVLGVREQPGRAVQETLVANLQQRHLLLVLDSCEHMVQVCAQLAEALLRGCDRLRILTTSRESLRVTGETVWRVRSLSLPSQRDERPIDEVARSEAGRLFVERAQAALPEFALDERRARAIADVCRRLDGIPLALELAAARVRLLDVEQIAARLDDRFRLLVGGVRTAPPRQQTLRAAVEWSYELLTESERRLFERLAVFASGWTLEGAEVVRSGDGLEHDDVLEQLGQLVDKSLVIADSTADGAVRYRMLETLREYAHERLAASGVTQSAAHRHAEYYVRLAERAEPELTGARQWGWLEQLEQEHDNLRAVLQWSLEVGQPELGLRLAGTMFRFWWLHGHLSEGRRLLESLLVASQYSGQALAPVRAKALAAAGRFAADQGDHHQATGLLEAALALFRELGDDRGSASSLRFLGIVALYQSDYTRAGELVKQCTRLYRELRETRSLATALVLLASIVMYQGDYRRAAALTEEGLALARELQDRAVTAQGLLMLGLISREQGDASRAATLVEDALPALRELGPRIFFGVSLYALGVIARDQSNYGRAAELVGESLPVFREVHRSLIAQPLITLAGTASDQGDYRRAAAVLEEALTAAREVGDKRSVAMGLEEMAAVASADGRARQAARLLGAAEALRVVVGAPRPPADRARCERRIAAARADLGDRAFAAAWDSGRSLALEDAVTEALTLVVWPPTSLG